MNEEEITLVGPSVAARYDVQFKRGELTIDPDTSRAMWRGHDVGLTFGEFRTVERLARAESFVSARALYDVMRSPGFHAGAGEDGFKTNVRSGIKRIRSKFRAVDEKFDHIGTYPGVGYRWRLS